MLIFLSIFSVLVGCCCFCWYFHPSLNSINEGSKCFEGNIWNCLAKSTFYIFFSLAACVINIQIKFIHFRPKFLPSLNSSPGSRHHTKIYSHYNTAHRETHASPVYKYIHSHSEIYTLFLFAVLL